MTRDRRSRDRRSERSVQFETRRVEERRDYPRFEIALDVREPSGRTRSCLGDLSPEGAAFVTTAPPLGDRVLVRFALPNTDGAIIAAARVVARSGVTAGTQVSVIFTDIHVEAQLAIAEWAQDRVVQKKARTVTRQRGPRPIPLTKVVERGWSRFKPASSLAAVP
ncbi:MAG: PilZ domain-containing protein [Myxococcaceae bacterium]|nr:PilZ domain-containing protein [Myxococcaceae bacterium]